MATSVDFLSTFVCWNDMIFFVEKVNRFVALIANSDI